jgi:hypothetical protein
LTIESLPSVMPGKSKRTTNNAVADYEDLDDLLAEL